MAQPCVRSQCCIPLCFSSDLILSVYTSDMHYSTSSVDDWQSAVSHEILWIFCGLSESMNSTFKRQVPPPPAAVSVPFLSLIELDIIILISDVEI